MSSRWNESWQRNRSTRRKPALSPLCAPQIPHHHHIKPGLPRCEAGNLTARAKARPYRLTLKRILNKLCLIHSPTCPNHSYLPVFIFGTRFHGAESLRTQQLHNQWRNSENSTELEDSLPCLQRLPLVCDLTQMNPVQYPYRITLRSISVFPMYV
jgi:hypothetical protein